MNPAFLKIISRFLPEIQKAASPAITGIINQVADEVKLEKGEESACIMLSQYKGEWWAFVVTMSSDNQVIRVCKQMKLDDLLSTGFSMIEKVC